MSSVVSATEARVHFGELIRRVSQQRETVYVERGGKPQVVLLAIAEYDRLLSQADSKGWFARAQEARRTALAEIAEAGRVNPEDLIRQARDERDEQLSSLR